VREFDNAALEWRRLFAELLGTFLLVLAGALLAVAFARVLRGPGGHDPHASLAAQGSPEA
jgi:glycerol uptake facilitator-like aquaporin